MVGGHEERCSAEVIRLQRGHGSDIPPGPRQLVTVAVLAVGVVGKLDGGIRGSSSSVNSTGILNAHHTHYGHMLNPC
jgi:hypothetical protein